MKHNASPNGWNKKESILRWPGRRLELCEPNWRETQSAAAISTALEARLCAGAPPLRHGQLSSPHGAAKIWANTTRYPRFFSAAGTLKKRRFARARQGRGCGHNLLGAGRLLPQPWTLERLLPRN